jgi:hypothetical protein
VGRLFSVSERLGVIRRSQSLLKLSRVLTMLSTMTTVQLKVLTMLSTTTKVQSRAMTNHSLLLQCGHVALGVLLLLLHRLLIFLLLPLILSLQMLPRHPPLVLLLVVLRTTLLHHPHLMYLVLPLLHLVKTVQDCHSQEIPQRHRETAWGCQMSRCSHYLST